MNLFIPASELTHEHIGKTVRVTIDKAQAEDMLQGMTHTARLIAEGRWSRQNLSIGPIETTLKFATLGDVDCEPGQKVAVTD